GAHVRLVERTRDGGRKILISGGGRCNVLPARLDESRFVTESSPRSLRNILRSWPLRDQIRFFEQDAGIPLLEEVESAKLFPASNRARDVRDGLLRLAAGNGVVFVPDTVVRHIAWADRRWIIEENSPGALVVDAVVLATGGLSVPATGSDGGGLQIARELGHTVHPTYAALTPLTATPAPFSGLAGLSLPVTVSACDGHRTATATGGFLFTHQGYSGPAILDVSHVAVRSDAGHPAEVRVQWTPLRERQWNDILRPAGAERVGTALRAHLPERLVAALAERAHVDPAQPLSQLRREDRLALVHTLVRSELPWSGHEGYKKAEVTGGGVSLDEIDSRTMESRRHEGLFLCGEMLDAFGPIGGYNFLWAWVTGRAAGLGAAGA
ncbi:MAG: NAD(P)/FAD-dependent oxidoreductase, partial [Acidobacteriota bacterium]